MTTPRRPYYQLATAGRDLFNTASDLVDAITDLDRDNFINDNQKTELLKIVNSIQFLAANLQKAEVDLDNQYWWKQNHPDETAEAIGVGRTQAILNGYKKDGE